MVGHVSGLGCPLAAPHSWGHLEASEKGGGMAGLPACVLPAGQTPPSTGTCSHTQIRSPLSSPTLCPETPIITGLQPPTQVLTPTPTLSPHMSFQTHRYTHPCKDTSYSFPLQGRVRGAAPGILPVSPLPPSTLYMSILLAPASWVLWGPASLCSQGTAAEAEPTSEPGQAEQRPVSLWHKTQLGQWEPWTGTFQKAVVPWLPWWAEHPELCGVNPHGERGQSPDWGPCSSNTVRLPGSLCPGLESPLNSLRGIQQPSFCPDESGLGSILWAQKHPEWYDGDLEWCLATGLLPAEARICWVVRLDGKKGRSSVWLHDGARLRDQDFQLWILTLLCPSLGQLQASFPHASQSSCWGSLWELPVLRKGATGLLGRWAPAIFTPSEMGVGLLRVGRVAPYFVNLSNCSIMNKTAWHINKLCTAKSTPNTYVTSSGDFLLPLAELGLPHVPSVLTFRWPMSLKTGGGLLPSSMRPLGHGLSSFYLFASFRPHWTHSR